MSPTFPFVIVSLSKLPNRAPQHPGTPAEDSRVQKIVLPPQTLGTGTFGPSTVGPTQAAI
jgi:hypothetical protein